ncbi:hypothetical protein ACFVWY_21320 [Streptomyces sp. NPDC058195]|uniref:hypothetical protein n=1 Tax=Streptomyces sp. NPDC058195 TaxID=3346375 RepID=UPI0036E34B74
MTRTAAIAVGALAGLLLSASAASAAPSTPADEPRPAHGVSQACEHLELVLAGLPVPAPATVCALVNGWD